MNYNYLTTIYRSSLTQIYVFPVLFTIFHFDLEKIISKYCKYIFFCQKCVHLGENTGENNVSIVDGLFQQSPLVLLLCTSCISVNGSLSISMSEVFIHVRLKYIFRKKCNNLYKGLSSARQLNSYEMVFRLCADDDPTFDAGL